MDATITNPPRVRVAKSRKILEWWNEFPGRRLMSITTKIQWCDSTCNPTMGCEGCELWNPKTGVKTCYAGVLHVRFGGKVPGYSPKFNQVTFYPGRMAEAAKWKNLAGMVRKDKPWMNGLPRLVFVSDMSDALSTVVPFKFLEAEIIGPVASDEGRRHRWLWLTKRPERMAKFSAELKARNVEWPENLWAGTSITSQATASRIGNLLRVGGEKTIRFLSVEPQSESIDLGPWLPRLNWIIQGGQSGAGSRPFHVEWASDLIQQCKEAGVAYFLKQLGSTVHREGRPLRFVDSHAGNWAEWPEHLRVRQMPEAPDAAYVVSDSKPEEVTRVSLDVIETENKGREAALKASATKRRNQAEHVANESGLNVPHVRSNRQGSRIDPDSIPVQAARAVQRGMRPGSTARSSSHARARQRSRSKEGDPST